LYRVALAWCGDPMLADDLVQEALTLGLQRVGQLRDTEKLYPWLYSILHNCWKHYLRRRRPTEDLDDETPGDGLDPEHLAHELEIVKRVRGEVAKLPVEQRKVLALVDLEGFSYAEVSEILEVPMGTVMSRLHRARKALCERLGTMDQGKSATSNRLRRVK
jgi:RNA polymerase sigma-70 factor (ECF subfamily)